MCRTQHQLDDGESRRIAGAGIVCFAERGFAGTTVRELACAAGVPLSHIYEHYRSKRALLGELVSAAYDRLLGQAVAAVADAPAAAGAQLEALVWALVDFHVRHKPESLLAAREIEQLDADARARVTERRQSLERLVVEVLEDGVRHGAFQLADPRAVARSVLAMTAAAATAEGVVDAQAVRRVARGCCVQAQSMAGASDPAAARAVEMLAGGPPAPSAVAAISAS